MSQPTVLCHYSKAKLAGYLAGACILVAVCVFCTTTDSPKGQIAGWTGIVFFGGGISFLVARLLSSSPVLTISHEGVCDKRWGIGVIPWRDITAIRIESVKVHASEKEFIGLQLRDEPAYNGKMPLRAKIPSALNQSIGFSAFIINCNGLDMDTYQVLRILKDSMRSTAGGTAAPVPRRGIFS